MNPVGQLLVGAVVWYFVSYFLFYWVVLAG